MTTQSTITYTLFSNLLHKTMIHYLVKCPSDPYENTNCFGDLDRAYDLCYNLSEEYGYAEIGYYNLQGHYQLVADYGSR